jgi:hypothetical protein
MAKRNRNSVKGTRKISRTGNPGAEEVNYRKLKDNPRHRTDENVSNRDHSANGKYSRIRRRGANLGQEDTRGNR